MIDFNKMFETVYNESDSSKMIAISISGIVGLIMYFFITQETPILIFTSLIIFPISKLTTSVILNNMSKHNELKLQEVNFQELYDELNSNEKKFIEIAFVIDDNEVIDWGTIGSNNLLLREVLISLVDKKIIEIINPLGTSDDQFKIKPGFFKIAKKEYANSIPF